MKIENFRDISSINPAIKKGIIYRSSALCLEKDKQKVINFLKQKNIGTIIDLRAYREYAVCQYSQIFFDNFEIIDAPFDPWQQSKEFIEKYTYGSHINIAYRFFAIECKQSIKIVMDTILNTNRAVVIHCHAGKDRTGVLVSLLHLLTQAPMEIVYTDYLASQMDTLKEYLQVFLDIVEDAGGVEQYLLSCGLTNEKINELKRKLIL